MHIFIQIFDSYIDIFLWIKYNYFRDSLDEAEYEETKEETIEQLKELNESLTKLVNGDISLIDAVGAVQLVSYVNKHNI